MASLGLRYLHTSNGTDEPFVGVRVGDEVVFPRLSFPGLGLQKGDQGRSGHSGHTMKETMEHLNLLLGSESAVVPEESESAWLTLLTSIMNHIETIVSYGENYQETVRMSLDYHSKKSLTLSSTLIQRTSPFARSSATS